MKQALRRATLTAAAVVLLAPALVQAGKLPQAQAGSTLEKSVRHELVMLPYYNVFDELSFQVDKNGVVTLMGEVTRPTLRSDAANVVKHVDGVTAVRNEIEVLPLSPFDDRIRYAVARAIYGYGPLNRYAAGAQPPIHIIVRNGNVTLTGYVGNEMDKNLANIRANQVPGVFSVTNDLKVDHS